MLVAFVEYVDLLDFEMLGVAWLVDPLVAVVMSSSSDVQDALAFCT